MTNRKEQFFYNGTRTPYKHIILIEIILKYEPKINIIKLRVLIWHAYRKMTDYLKVYVRLFMCKGDYK